MTFYEGVFPLTKNRIMKKLANRTVFITGGLSGIGKACAIAVRSTIDVNGHMAPDVVDRLERLGEMHRRGDITSDEFDTAKRHVLGDQR